MIEITKQNETFQLKESTDNGWAMSGSASKEVSGSYSINFSVTKPGELSEYIGDCSYYKPSEDGQVSTQYRNKTEMLLWHTQTQYQMLYQLNSRNSNKLNA